jgi:hypothetical protein
MVVDPARHVPLEDAGWDAEAARAALVEIVDDAVARFDPEVFWPAHPMDEGVLDGNSSLYWGAAGAVWGLDYLRRIGRAAMPIDFVPTLPGLLARTQAEMTQFGDYAELGSLLFGDLGTALVARRLAPTPELDALIARRVEANDRLPVREVMWGTPGSMLACLHMSEMTGEARWRTMFAAQAARLLGDLEDSPSGPIWTQDLYGNRTRFLGPVHGFAGNMLPLLRGWSWLDDGQRRRVGEATLQTLPGLAHRAGAGVNWSPRAEAPPRLCQYCHGAPGMVATFADAPFTAPDFERLLVAGGEFAWATGPLLKGSNLCHGTGGNGYAFLKLYRRTGDALWLERARAFAMTAIAQCRAARAETGRGRYSLWTGDIGFAIYLADCLRGEGRFPTVDVF